MLGSWGAELLRNWEKRGYWGDGVLGYRRVGKTGMLSYGGARGTGLGASRSAEEDSVLGCWEFPGSWGAAAASSRGAGVPGYRGAGVNGAGLPAYRVPGLPAYRFPTESRDTGDVSSRSTDFPGFSGAEYPGVDQPVCPGCRGSAAPRLPAAHGGAGLTGEPNGGGSRERELQHRGADSSGVRAAAPPPARATPWPRPGHARPRPGPARTPPAPRRPSERRSPHGPDPHRGSPAAPSRVSGANFTGDGARTTGPGGCRDTPPAPPPPQAPCPRLLPLDLAHRGAALERTPRKQLFSHAIPHPLGPAGGKAGLQRWIKAICTIHQQQLLFACRFLARPKACSSLSERY